MCRKLQDVWRWIFQPLYEESLACFPARGFGAFWRFSLVSAIPRIERKKQEKMLAKNETRIDR